MRAAVRDGYGKIAQRDGSCCSGANCCGSNAEDSGRLAQYVGYSVEELAALPDGANMGLSCGNPSALAALRPGEVVLDLGSGVAGSVLVSETERMARETGLTAIRLNPKQDYVAAMTDWNDSLYQEIAEQLRAGSGPGDYITSLEVTASKPAPAKAAACCC